MMRLRGSVLVVALCAAACASPSTAQHAAAAETAAMAPLKRAYPDVVMGFDVKGGTTLVISLDLQAYDGMNDDDAAAMESRAVSDWRKAWTNAHPGDRKRLRVRFIDFIGRTIAERTVNAS